MISFARKTKKPFPKPKKNKTLKRLAELRTAHRADALRAAADILARDYHGGFQGFKSNGWAVMICGRPLPHRRLIARTIWYASKRRGESPIVLTTDDFEGNGLEYKEMLRERFGLTIIELPETTPMSP